MRIFILLMLLVASAGASPFLVCDPYPANLDQFTKPTSFVVTGLVPSPLTTPAFVNLDGTVQIHYDLATLPKGSYTVTASAVNALGGVSPQGSPFHFHQHSSGRPK